MAIKAASGYPQYSGSLIKPTFAPRKNMKQTKPKPNRDRKRGK